MVFKMFRAGQGGSLLHVAPEDRSTEGHVERPSTIVGDRTPDACWYWGFYYYNPDDPALLVESRFGSGYTLNMGKPAARLLMGALVVAILGILIALLLFAPFPD